MIKGANLGVDLINDVSGFRFDPKSLTKLKYYKIAKVLHHMQGLVQQCKKSQISKCIIRCL